MSKFKVGQLVEVDSAEYEGLGRVVKVDTETLPHGYLVQWDTDFGADAMYFAEEELEAVR